MRMSERVLVSCGLADFESVFCVGSVMRDDGVAGKARGPSKYLRMCTPSRCPWC
jgi:hypothetical protein